jgi:adenosylmethionine-8-amino-7-oxononanoate aminotransferase
MMNIIQRDLQHHWHPCSQMKDYETFSPLIIKRAKGCILELQNGQYLIDAISSWWCKPLGHGHPRLKKALLKQLNKYEHVLAVNTCQEPLVTLSEKLCNLTKTLKKVFFASEGSSAVEIALKMSLHARKNRGESHRNQFIAFENGYHGETCMALAVSDVGLYREPYQALFPSVSHLKPIPYINSSEDPLWEDCSSIWPMIESNLNQQVDTLCAIIFEPIIQGSTGMRLYSQDFLRRLQQWAKKNQVYLIADEIMTGLGRTGYPLACQYANIEPDFICLSKGLTGGFLPMSAVLTTNEIYQLFYDDYEKNKSFLHSHTFSGNALAAAVAVECLNILEDEDIYQRVRTRESHLRACMNEVANKTTRLNNIRGIGGIIAADLVLEPDKPAARYGYRVYQEAVKLGALLRPLGNTIYWLPPLNITTKVLMDLKDITIAAIQKVD